MFTRSFQVQSETWSSRMRKRKGMGDGPVVPSIKKIVGAAAPQSEPWKQMILAGYMAEEFLTKGTMLGRKCDAAHFVSKRSNKTRWTQFGPSKAEPNSYKPPPAKTYHEVAALLKGDGPHIPGVVNPTQLGQWLQM